MQDYFTDFLKTGNPNGENLAQWPSVDSHDANLPIIILDVENKARKATNDNRYLFLDNEYFN